MLYNASIKYTPGSSYKYNDVAELIRGKKINDAIIQLSLSKKGSASPILKLLKSCIANAKNNFNASTDKLMVHRVEVGKSFTLKRLTIRGRGRTSRINKPYSNIKIFLKEIVAK